MGCASSSQGNDVTTPSAPADKQSQYSTSKSVADSRPPALVATETTPVIKAQTTDARSDGKAYVGSDNIKSHQTSVVPVEPSTKSAAEAPGLTKKSGVDAAAAHSHANAADAGGKGKGRRAAAGTEAIRDQIRKLAAGGTAEDQQEVSDSEDEDDEDLLGGQGWAKPPEVTTAICEALQKNFVFRGISDKLLHQVVDRMHGMCFMPGATLLHQGAAPKPDDCMYFLQHGDAEVVISGAVDQNAKAKEGEQRQVVGHTVRIGQKPGWVFGDIALLFNSSRTASVMAKTNITVWALDRRTFLKFVMKHAQGARALRFLRKLPLLKGLSDNDLIAAASQMPQREYQDGEALIKYGERGDELFLIRYGKVRVMRPDGNGGKIEAVVLGRGQFVGERAVINNKLRSADCVAKGLVKVVVMRKRDFISLDNPLLAWMMDYDAVSACLRVVPYVRGIAQEQMEGIMDRFDAREEYKEGQELVAQGDMVDKLFVIKIGEVRLLQDGRQVTDPDFVRESGGFTFFGDAGLQQPFRCPYTVVVASEVLQMLCLPKAQLDSFLGVGTGLTTVEAVIGALKKSKAFKGVGEAELKKVVSTATERTYNAGDVIVSAASGPCGSVFLVKGGEAVLVSPDVALPGQVDLGGLVERGRLPPGSLFNEEAAAGSDYGVDLKASLVASTPGTTVMAFSRDEVTRARSNGTGIRARSMASGRLQNVRFTDLEMHRIIGTGQFGLVRLVRNLNGGEVYALKLMHKAPISESKQIEHVINERRILEEASHAFCVQLRGAYQDKLCLYLLQEWVPGGELFHHLDIMGAFDEPTSAFFAANVLLSLEFLHNKGIVYRDLKPENLLVDAQGYLKMADFGFAKHVAEDKTFTICGTPDYQAPEVIMRRGTTKAADYWALGVLIYEMLVGDPPFKSDTPGDAWDTFRKALSGRFNMPTFISAEAQDIIWKLLQLSPERRLGSGRLGAEEIKRHPFFAGIDWQLLEQKKLVAPIRPRIVDPLDTSNFDNFDSCDVDPPPIPKSHAEKQPNWDMWEWIE